MFLFLFFIFGFSRVFAQVTAVFFLRRKFESLRCSRGAVLFFFVFFFFLTVILRLLILCIFSLVMGGPGYELQFKWM